MKEIGLSLSSRLEKEINIYTPYEKTDKVLAPKLRVRAVPNSIAALGLNDIIYSLSKKLYYNRLFSRSLLNVMRLSASIFSDNLGKLLVKDGARAIQAEQDFSLPLALRLGEQLDLPVVADLHNISSEELVAVGVMNRESKSYSDFQSSMREWLSRVDFVCVVSEEMKRYVETEYDCPGSKVRVVPPGGRLRAYEDHVKQSQKVVFAGTVSRRERVDLFVRSLPYVMLDVPEARFYSTGKGEDLPRIAALCDRLDVAMNWTWFPDEEDLFRFLSSCSVGALPSSNDVARIMGTPIKLMDYMSAGLPVVSNYVGGWSDIIKHENVGLLTDHTPRDFASGILRLLHDEDLRMKMSLNATRSIKEKYNWHISVEPLAKAYENLL